MTNHNEQEKRRNSISDEDDIGVLLVHGIGSSKQGDTLAKWAKAILDCFRGIDDDAKIIGLESELKANSDQAFIRSKILPNNNLRPFCLRISEAWWAEAFTPPAFNKILGWSFLAIPWIAVSHFDDRFRRAGIGFDNAWKELLANFSFKTAGNLLINMLNTILEMVWLFFGLLLAPVLLAAFIIVAILGIIPLRSVREFAAGILRILTGTLGDSYVFVENVVIRQAVTDRIVSELYELADTTKKLFIIAHSQGAAVTHYALKNVSVRDDKIARAIKKHGVQRLLTFGSGLRKLRSLQRIRSGKWLPHILAMITMAFATAAAIVMVYSGISLSKGVLSTPPGRLNIILTAIVMPFAINLAGLLVRTVLEAIYKKFGMKYTDKVASFFNLIGLGVILTLAWFLLQINSLVFFKNHTFWIGACLGISFTFLMFWRYSANRASDQDDQMDNERDDEWPNLKLDTVEHWDDVYAGLDPVSNGGVLDYADKVGTNLTTMEISNWSNIILDHTSYWSNKRQFVEPIAQTIESLATELQTGQIDTSAASRFSSRSTQLSDAENLLFRVIAVAIIVGLPLYIFYVHGNPANLALAKIFGEWLRNIPFVSEATLESIAAFSKRWSWGIFTAVLFMIYVMVGRLQSAYSRSRGQKKTENSQDPDQSQSAS